MRLTVRIRGKPEAVSSVLKKMDNDSNCYVYVSVGSEDELLKIISLSVESGAFVEIIPGETPPLQYNPESANHSRNVDQGNDVVKGSSEASLLSKYKRRVETKVSSPQTAEQEKGKPSKPHEEVKVREESASQPPPPSPPPAPPPQPSSPHSSSSQSATPATQPPRQDRKSPEGKSSKPDVESILAKAEEEASQTEEIQFEELVKMKEEAFSRKIIE